MPYQISDPVDIPGVRQVLQALEAEIAERERVATALANKNAQRQSALQRRLAECESFNRALVSLLQKTVLDQVLDIVCTEAQGLIGATGSAVLLLTDQAWLEVKRRLGKPLAAIEPVPVDGSLAGQVVRRGAPVVLNDPAQFERAQVYQWPTDLSALLAVPLHVNGGVIGVRDVVNKAGGFTEDDVPVMSVFANQAAMALAAGKQDVTAGYLQELQETAQEGMRDMRLLIFQLHPPVLETEGLAAALQARLAAVEGRAGLQTEFRVEGERRLPMAIESDLYWIAHDMNSAEGKQTMCRPAITVVVLTLAHHQQQVQGSDCCGIDQEGAVWKACAVEYRGLWLRRCGVDTELEGSAGLLGHSGTDGDSLISRGSPPSFCPAREPRC